MTLRILFKTFQLMKNVKTLLHSQALQKQQALIHELLLCRFVLHAKYFIPEGRDTKYMTLSLPGIWWPSHSAVTAPHSFSRPSQLWLQVDLQMGTWEFQLDVSALSQPARLFPLCWGALLSWHCPEMEGETAIRGFSLCQGEKQDDASAVFIPNPVLALLWTCYWACFSLSV